MPIIFHYLLYFIIFLSIPVNTLFGAITSRAAPPQRDHIESSEFPTDINNVRNTANRAVTGSHADRFSVYEGTRTCLACHETEAREVHASVHYQWQGDASKTVGLDSPKAGKLGGMNDFCIYADINWIGKLTTVNGNQVDGGCATCHVGLGEKPNSEPTQSQLENIDCLLCHSETYKRKVEMVDGSFRFVPDTNNMTVTLLQAAVDLKRPGNDSCLDCHAFGGGGNNFKRGDLEEAHKNPTLTLDVHMASTADGGAGLNCLDCHTSTSHKISGRGTDLRPLDSASVVSCLNCHGEQPHNIADLNKHTARIHCAVCHIPTFAKVAPTDMDRDWSHSGVLVEEKGLYEPYHQKGQNVQPVYKFFNGLSYFYQFGDIAGPGQNGRVIMAAPMGDIHDPGAQILAFKHHLATLPIDPVTDRVLPMKIGLFFQTGQVDEAIKLGAEGVGWEYNGHNFVLAERYMGLFHEVSPKSQALSCNSCHNQGTLMDFASLGYTPKTTYNEKPLCAACHGDKTDEWNQNEFFDKVHEKHVTDKKYDCITCHTFSSAGNNSPGPPRAATVIATSIQDISAKLHGTVHPNGIITTAVYEYGTDTSYGNSIIATQSPLSGTSAQTISAALSDLIANTTYHFRLKATNSQGTSYGGDLSFKTSTGVPTVFSYVSSDGNCGTKAPCYSRIQDAIDNAATGSAILLKQETYTESISLGSNKVILIKGGYDSTYNQQTANTTFIQAPGPTTIKASSGSLKFEMISVK